MREFFDRAASWVSKRVGSAIAFFFAFLIILVWAITGPLFGFSDTWQLVINTGTTIITFLMVFLIQATQNRDTLAVHLKLDELLIAVQDARERVFVDIEEKSMADVEEAHDIIEERLRSEHDTVTNAES